MENKRTQNKNQIKHGIYNNVTFSEINSNSNQIICERCHQLFSPQNRGRTPIYTRVRNFINRENNNNNLINSNEKEEYNNISISNTNSINNTPNHQINSKRNVNNNNMFSVNYTMRGSNYSNYSGSGFTALTQIDNLNAKCNCNKNLFNNVKGHNMALMNRINNEKNLTNENVDLDINYVLLKENQNLKDEIRKLLFNKDKKKINKVYEEDKEEINNNLDNNIINTNNKIVFDKIIKEKNNLNNLVDNLKNQIKTLKNEKELNEKKNKRQIDE